MSMGITAAFAADTGTITITPPSGLDASATNTYKVYKVFDAFVNADDNTKVSYKLCSGDTLSAAMTAAGFSVDSAGNVSGPASLNDAAIAAIAAYVTEADLVDTVSVTGTTATATKALGYGYYYITTSTGTVVTIDSNNNNPTVNDKNTVPGLDKKITNTNAEPNAAGMAGTIDEDGKKALAELGKDVEYTATITVGKGAKGYEFHDKMGTGLTFKDGSVTVTANPAISTENWYTIKDTPDTGDTLTITFVDGIAENTVITIKYIGTVNSDALTIDTGKNTARVDYGDENSNNHTPDSETNVYNAKLSVNKVDGSSQPLPGAGFIVKNADNKYYKNSNGVVTWVAEDQADIHTSGQDGVVPPFTGLVDGTYTLIEKTVPSGYNKAADSTFTIAAKDYNVNNLVQGKTVINNAGAELPSTGGIGTTIFYVVGSIMVVAAGVLLITKKRMSREG